MGENINAPKIEKWDEEEKAAVSKFMRDVSDRMADGLSLTNDVGTKVVSVTFRGAGQSTPVTHGLGRVPKGWNVVGTKDDFKVREDARQRSADRIYLISDTASVKADIMFF